jgi:O-acetyl-ADP-ribose deacetylase (regulator of RNase III)
MTITYLKGDATQPAGGGPKIIAHICNDIGGWGRGFVLAVSARWSEPERAYRQMAQSCLQPTLPLGEVQLVNVEPELWVANMVGQRGVVSYKGVSPIRYEAVRKCLTKLGEHAKALGASIHMPRIGCGLAGGSWDQIEPLIESCLSDVKVFVYDLM